MAVTPTEDVARSLDRFAVARHRVVDAPGGRRAQSFGLGLGRARPQPAEEGIEERLPQVDVLRRDAVYRRSLAASDMLAASLALVVCAIVLGDDALQPFALLALPLVVLAGQMQGLYDRDDLVINKTTLDQAPQLFQLATLYALLVLVLENELIVGRLSTAQIVVLWGGLFLFTLCGRFASRSLSRRLTVAERCLFVGSDHSFRRLEAKLRDAARSVSIVARATSSDEDVRSMTGLRRLIERHDVHRVIIEPSEDSVEDRLDIVRHAKATGARVSLLPRVLDVVGSSIEIDDIDGLTLLGVRRFGLSRSQRAVKRTFDVVGASVSLLVVAPALALVALLVRLEDGGGPLYRQTRIGRHGEPFEILKFRTMVAGADGMKSNLRSLNEARGGLFKIADDPRVTRIGRQLRRFSLDELPQLFNVLRGEMSLVGPRPLVLDEDLRITGLDRSRLHLTPGMTGHWQILGSARVPLPEMLKLDYRYVASWSLWADVKILLRTVPYVLARRGM